MNFRRKNYFCLFRSGHEAFKIIIKIALKNFQLEKVFQPKKRNTETLSHLGKMIENS